jgi:hypothetical protein
MSPFDQLDDRLASLIETVERGEPIDFAKDARLAALDTVVAGVHFARQAIDESNRHDQAMLDAMKLEDEGING